MKRTQIKNAGRRRKNRWGSRALAALLCAVMLFSAADISIFARGTAVEGNPITEPQEDAESPLTPEAQEGEDDPPQDEETEAEPVGQENTGCAAADKPFDPGGRHLRGHEI